MTVFHRKIGESTGTVKPPGRRAGSRPAGRVDTLVMEKIGAHVVRRGPFACWGEEVQYCLDTKRVEIAIPSILYKFGCRIPLQLGVMTREKTRRRLRILQRTVINRLGSAWQ